MGKGSPLPLDGDQTGPQRVPLPIGGVASASTFRDQPTRFLPPELTRNVRPFDVAKDRPRLGTTPGIVKLVPQQFGGGAPIQDLNTVSRASVVAGYHLGSAARIFGRSSLAPAVAGQIFGFRAGGPPQLEWDALVDVTGEGGPTPLSISAIGRHPDTDLVVVATTQYNNGSDPHLVCRVVAFDRYGAQVWSTKISNASKDVFINTVAVSRLYTLVTANETVKALRNDTGVVVATTDCNQWSDECVEARVWRDPATSNEYLYVLFNGKNTVATLPNGTGVTAGFYAKSFRSGVMKFLLAGTDYTQSPVFTQVQWGRQLATTDTFYEASHGYFRISENSVLKPRGAIVNALAVDAAGDVYIARCNAGGGPNATWTPDLAEVQPITVCKITAAGTMAWEIDTDSIVRVGFLGFLNDIPNGAGVEPSIQAVAVDSTSGSVFAGGAPNTATACAFGISGGDGVVRWGVTLEATVGPPNDSIHQACVGVDPSDGNPVFGGSNTVAYSGGGSPNAHTLKLSAVNGAVMWIINESNAVANNGIAIFDDGRIVLACDQV